VREWLKGAKNMARRRGDIGTLAELPNDATPPDVGEDLGDLEKEKDIEQANTSTPALFGTFAHAAYEVTAYDRFDNVVNEEPVRITKSDNTQTWGRIDTIVNNRVIIDYKTNDMRDWDVDRARAAGRSWEHGPKVKAYVDSPDTPTDSQGWIIATVPPRSEQVRQAYSDTLAEYSVGAKFAEGEDQDSVMKAVAAAVEDTETGLTSEVAELSGDQLGMQSLDSEGSEE